MDTKEQETIKVNTKEHYAILPNGEKIHLKNKEVQTLLFLSKDTFIEYRKLDKLIAGSEFHTNNLCSIYINYLRNKLGRNCIINVRFSGYKLGNHIEFIDEVPEAVRFATWLGSKKVNILSDYQKWIELGKPG